MSGPSPNPTRRPLGGDPIATDQFVPGEGEILMTVVDLIETERDVDLTQETPFAARVDWDALDKLLDDETRSMNVASVVFSYHDVVVRITGTGQVTLYDDPEVTESVPALDSADDGVDCA